MTETVSTNPLTKKTTTSTTASSAAFSCGVAFPPFGVCAEESAKATEKSSSAVFPPTSTAALKSPFSAKKPSPYGAATFPPMSATAPTTFGVLFSKNSKDKASDKDKVHNKKVDAVAVTEKKLDRVQQEIKDIEDKLARKKMKEGKKTRGKG